MSVVAILVDECRWPHQGRRWCHLVSDSSYDELHAFARGLGIPRVAFQGDHYDLHEDGRALALAHGAMPIDSRSLVRALDRAGLRRGPAIGRRGLAGVVGLPAPELTTGRLRLRQWRTTDVAALAALEPAVPDPAVPDRAHPVGATDVASAYVDAQAVALAVRGYGMWALERSGTGELIGRAGLTVVGSDSGAPFAPAVELSCRMAPAHRGQGLATEAAGAALDYGFAVLGASFVVAVMDPDDDVARSLAHRLGMRHVPAWDFVATPTGAATTLRRRLVTRADRPGR